MFNMHHSTSSFHTTFLKASIIPWFAPLCYKSSCNIYWFSRFGPIFFATNISLSQLRIYKSICFFKNSIIHEQNTKEILAVKESL